MTVNRALPPIELLAPAGDFEKLRLAVRYGADAVYLSAGDFSLRAAGASFTGQTLGDAVTYAHNRGVRVYLAINMLAHPADLDRLAASLNRLLAAGPDAVIVADPGVFDLIRTHAPDLPVHISTQASTCNAAACRFWHRQGARRIVLARELSLAEIRQIRASCPPDLELEGFVHGAMCLAYSGRCLLSAHLTGRDANRGQCTQPCRWSWQITEQQHPDKPMTVIEDSRGTYILNSRDLCMIGHIPDLAGAGLSSWKIEGRTKSSFYVATAVKAYREAIDTWLASPEHYRTNPAWLADLDKTVHRPFSTGFYYDPPGKTAQVSADSINVRDADVAGIIRAWIPESSLALIEQRNRIRSGDLLELVMPEGRHRLIRADGLLDLERQPISSTPHPRMLYYLPLAEAAPADAFLRIPSRAENTGTTDQTG